MKTTTFFFTLLAVLVFASKPVLSEPSTEQNAVSGISRTIIRIQNLSCAGCFGKIREKLATLNGFLNMKASLRNRLVAIDSAPPLTAGMVVAAINEIGYRTVVISSPDLAAATTATSAQTSGCGNGGSCCTKGPEYSASQGGGGSAATAQPSCCQAAVSGRVPGIAPGDQNAAGGCCASIDAWKQLINTLFTKTPDQAGTQTTGRTTP